MNGSTVGHAYNIIAHHTNHTFGRLQSGKTKDLEHNYFQGGAGSLKIRFSYCRNDSPMFPVDLSFSCGYLGQCPAISLVRMFLLHLFKGVCYKILRMG